MVSVQGHFHISDWAPAYKLAVALAWEPGLELACNFVWALADNSLWVLAWERCDIVALVLGGNPSWELAWESMETERKKLFMKQWDKIRVRITFLGTL